MRSIRIITTAVTLASVLALAACDKAGKAPEGQVVATVDGKDVTIAELNAEIGQIPNRGGDAPRKLVESVALARVIERKMLAAEAGKRKLDNSPQFLLARERGNEALLVQALQADVQKTVKPVPRDTALKFVTDNPQVFADRKIFSLDQIQFLRPANIDQLPFKDAKSMAEVEKILVDANIEYRRAPQQLDSLTVNPALTKEITRLSTTTTEPFMFADQPAGAPAPIIYVNSVIATKTDPFIGEKAVAYATNILQRQAVEKALSDELKTWQQAYKSKIQYGKGYGPPAMPKPAGAKPAAAPPPPMPAAVPTTTSVATPTP